MTATNDQSGQHDARGHARPSLAAVRKFLAESERHLRSLDGPRPQAIDALLIRHRAIAALGDDDLERLVTSLRGDLSMDQLEAGLTSFAEMFSDPELRAFTGLPPHAEAAVQEALAAEQAGCRHVLARAAAGSRTPGFICLTHPRNVRCGTCHTEHVDSGHTREHELTCDWCGAVCLREIFPMPLALGSIAVVRNFAAKRRWHVGPVYLNGLGACYRCHLRLVRESRSFADVLAEVDRQGSAR